jgi:4a-hydroxytetrahydrobiopterin dehydratase
MATLLDQHLVTDALQGLDGWSSDDSSLTKSVTLADETADQLLAEVATTADAMDHHPDVERTDGRIDFRLSTHSAGGITELDIMLAARIDDLIRHLTGGAPTGGTTVAEPNLPGPGSVPTTSAESATGDDDAEKASGLMHPPAAPRGSAGPIAAPDVNPGAVEPMPRPGGPGMHEPAPDESDT